MNESEAGLLMNIKKEMGQIQQKKSATRIFAKLPDNKLKKFRQ